VGVELGEGSFSRVVHVRLKEHGLDLALKVMPKELLRREGKVTSASLPEVVGEVVPQVVCRCQRE
jgi:hypothetical protein